MNLGEFNIAAVERDTGLSKDVLRVWERRYGFPIPTRDANGERLYPADQVERLRLIKRLMDQGHRPGKLFAKPAEELAGLAPRRVRAVPDPAIDQDELSDLIGLIKRHDSAGYQQAMQQRLARKGLSSFVKDAVAPLTQRIGEAWEEGSLEVFEEHLFTELTKRLLRQAITTLPAGNAAPRIVLTSVPDEPHVLGLLMAEALLSLEGAQCIPLGTQMPLLEIVRAAGAHRADVVALSFSIAFPQRQIGGLLEQVRLMLPADVALWAGGRGIARQSPVPGTTLLTTLDEAVAAVHDWRATHA